MPIYGFRTSVQHILKNGKLPKQLGNVFVSIGSRWKIVEFGWKHPCNYHASQGHHCRFSLRCWWSLLRQCCLLVCYLNSEGPVAGPSESPVAWCCIALSQRKREPNRETPDWHSAQTKTEIYRSINFTVAASLLLIQPYMQSRRHRRAFGGLSLPNKIQAPPNCQIETWKH